MGKQRPSDKQDKPLPPPNPGGYVISDRATGRPVPVDRLGHGESRIWIKQHPVTAPEGASAERGQSHP